MPLSQTKVVLNWNIQGANLSPSNRDITLAIASESGGALFTSKVADAFEDIDLDMRIAREALGAGRSAHQRFLDVGVPAVFFTDGTNGCYLTHGDELKTVDFVKLEKQAQAGVRLAYDLISTTGEMPSFRRSGLIPVGYSDAVVLSEIADGAVNDLAIFPEEIQESVVGYQEVLNRIETRGPLFFLLSILRFIRVAPELVNAFRAPDCDGYLLP